MPAVMPAWGDAEGHCRAIVVIVVATITRIVVAATIIRARRTYADAHAAGASVKANLRHCRRGGEDGRCCNKAERDLFHDVSPLSTWIGKRLRRSGVPQPALFWSQVPRKNYRTNFVELWNKRCPSATRARSLRSLGGDAQPFGRFLMLGLLAAQPGLEAIEIEIDHRRREQGQELAQRQAADHGIAERVAQFRSRAGAEHQRQAAQ